MSDYFERIVAGAPVNATAAKQMGKGEHWAPAIHIMDYFEDRPPIVEIDPAKITNHDFVNFTGRVFGRLTVIGIMAKPGNTPTSWVCRCQCGAYCPRKTKSLKIAARNGNSFVDRCGRCHYVERLREGRLPELKNRKMGAG